MRRRDKRLLTMLLNALTQRGSEPRQADSLDIDTTLPADLMVAEEKVRCCEQEWQKAGAVRATEQQVEEALQNAKGLQSEFNEVRRLSRRSLRLRYLNLVRLFVLTGLPRHGKAAVMGGAAAAVLRLSMLLSPFLFRSLWAWADGAATLTVLGSCLTTAAIYLLWPTVNKREAFNRLFQQWKERKEQVKALRPGVDRAWEDYRYLRQHYELYGRLEKTRQRREEIAALLTSEKYQLIHTDWRSLRGADFRALPVPRSSRCWVIKSN